jgi:flagellin
MTRINTNVSSLVAQGTLKKSNAALEQALTRLSTGLRINTGKDDPAGLIASENLRSDITSIQKAIGNTDRANQVIATADSALGQVSSLLNDIRGLVTEAANSGGLSDAQIQANQLQIDSSLDALNRIAKTVTFQGRKLLDGSLDFTTTAGTNYSKLSSLQIDQANLGATGSVSVAVDVTAAATNAEVDITGVPTSTAGVSATTSLTLSNSAAQAVFHFDFDTTTAAGVTVTALSAGAAGNAAGNGITVVLAQDATAAGAVNSVTFSSGTLTVNGDFTSGTLTNTEVAAAIQASAAGANFTAAATGTANTNLVAADVNAGITPVYTTNGRSVGSTTFSVTSDTVGAGSNGVTVTLTEDSSITNNTATAAITGGNIAVKIHGTVTKQAIITAINGLAGYSAVATGTPSGDLNYIESSDTAPGVATVVGGVDAIGGLAQDAVIELSGLSGSEVFNFKAGTAIADLASAINLVKDATGVEATVNGTTLELTSSAYGSAAFVDIKKINEGGGGTFGAVIGEGTRNTGTDIVATVNGISAIGDGNTLSANSSTLALKTTVDAGFTGSIAFDITGGGALFQLGPDVVSNQQARIGITSVNTARLGGVSGLLYQLGKGGSADLATSATTAANIVGEAIDQVTTLRGRLGAFQRTLLETNKNALSDTLVNLTDAQSQIRDADFAAETAALTRAQILVQSGTTVLQVANQNPQNVLSLLR